MRQKMYLMVMGLLLTVCLMAGTAAAKQIELTMYYPVAVGGPLTRVIDGMVDEFMAENPGIKVNAIYAGSYNDARIKALAALKGGQPPQLSVLFSIDMYELIEQGAIVAFDDVVQTAEEKAWLDSFHPAFMENGRTGGKTWGIPFKRSTIVMFHNKDLFKQAGLDPEQPPTTWDEMVSMGKQLTTPDRWGIMIPSTGYPYWMFGALAMQNGQVLMNRDGNATYFDHPAVIEALQFWKDLNDKHGVMPAGTIEWGTLRQKFLEGKTAMMWHSTGNLRPVKDNADFDFGVAMLPANKRRGTPTGGGNFYIFKQTTPEERRAALQLIKFMTSPENSAKWSVKTGFVGTSPAAYNTATLKDYVSEFPYAAVAKDQLAYATAELSTYQAGRIRKTLDDAIQAVLTGAKTPEAALKEAQGVADRLLKPYR